MQPLIAPDENRSQLKAILLPKLRMQFAEFLSQSSLKRLRFLTSPTCVGLRYGHEKDSMRSFSWKCGIDWFMEHSSSSSSLSVKNPRLFLRFPLTELNPLPMQGQPILLRHSSSQHHLTWCRNINLLSIAYAFRPQLRIRLTLGGLTLPRKP